MDLCVISDSDLMENSDWDLDEDTTFDMANDNFNERREPYIPICEDVSMDEELLVSSLEEVERS